MGRIGRASQASAYIAVRPGPTVRPGPAVAGVSRDFTSDRPEVPVEAKRQWAKPQPITGNSSDPMTLERVIELLDLLELRELSPFRPDSGRWAPVWSDENSSAFYYLMSHGDFAALRRLAGPELWHHYAGAAVNMLILGPNGTVERHVLGDDLEAGQRPVVAAAAGVFFGAATVGEWSLVGTTMAPSFDYSNVELAKPTEVLAAFPDAARDIAQYIWNTP